jgi:hypothetical protein
MKHALKYRNDEKPYTLKLRGTGKEDTKANRVLPPKTFAGRDI